MLVAGVSLSIGCNGPGDAQGEVSVHAPGDKVLSLRAKSALRSAREGGVPNLAQKRE